LSAGTAVSVQVRRGNNLSAVRTATVAAASPGLFIVNQASGTGAVLHASSHSLVDANSPARPGESLLIYCTGLGALGTSVKSGDRAPSVPPLAETIFLPVVTIASLPATVIYSGLAPGAVGMYQITVQVPVGLPIGNQTVQITTQGVASNTATIAVAH
jgi:uncharacterized protein (TIGR03437 family)